MVPFKNWLAIRDSTYGLCQLNMSVLNLEPHLILLDDQRSIADAEAQPRIRDWLTEVPVQLVMNNLAPTLFVDFDGTLHVGNTYIGEDDEIMLDTSRPLLEFAPLLAELLAPYPDVEIVATTSWASQLPDGRSSAICRPNCVRV